METGHWCVRGAIADLTSPSFHRQFAKIEAKSDLARSSAASGYFLEKAASYRRVHSRAIVEDLDLTSSVVAADSDGHRVAWLKNSQTVVHQVRQDSF